MAEVRVRDTRTKQVLEGTRPKQWVDIFPHLEEVSDNVADKATITRTGTAPSDAPQGEKGGK